MQRVATTGCISCASIQYAGGSRRPALDPPMAQASVARARRSGGVALDPEDGNIFGEAADCRRPGRPRARPHRLRECMREGARCGPQVALTLGLSHHKCWPIMIVIGSAVFCIILMATTIGVLLPFLLMSRKTALRGPPNCAKRHAITLEATFLKR